MSGLRNLPPHVQTYLHNMAEKKRLLGEIRKLQVEIKMSQPKVNQFMDENQLTDLPITPANQLEQAHFGENGVLRRKVRKEPETLNRTNLQRLLTEFYQTFLGYESDGAQRMAAGQASWIWKNRVFYPKEVLERTYVSDMKERAAKKRRMRQGPANPRARNVDPPNMPATKHEFMQIPEMREFLSM